MIPCKYSPTSPGWAVEPSVTPMIGPRMAPSGGRQFQSQPGPGGQGGLCGGQPHPNGGPPQPQGGPGGQCCWLGPGPSNPCSNACGDHSWPCMFRMLDGIVSSCEFLHRLDQQRYQLGIIERHV